MFYGGVFNRLFRSTVSLQLVSMGGFKATALEFVSSSAKNDAFHQFQKLNHDLGCIIKYNFTPLFLGILVLDKDSTVFLKSEPQLI